MAVQHADEIVVFDDGQIIERGNHAQLLALGGHYAGLTGLVLAFDMMISWWTTFPSEGD